MLSLIIMCYFFDPEWCGEYNSDPLDLLFPFSLCLFFVRDASFFFSLGKQTEQSKPWAHMAQ